MFAKTLPRNLNAKDLFTGISRSSQQLCEICGSGLSSEGNVIVLCDGCDLAVHQTCYNIPRIPEDGFLCNECQVKNENIELWGDNRLEPLEPHCVICPVTKDCLRGMKTVLYKSRRIGMGHVVCAMFIPGTQIQENRMDFSKVYDEYAGKNAECNLCKNQNVGLSVKCSYPDCTVWSHASCASSPVAEETGFELNFDSKTLACPCHSSFAVNFPEKAEEFMRSIQSEHSFHQPLATPGNRGLGTSNTKKRRATSSPTTLERGQKGAKPDPTWLNRRVSIFMEGVIGTAISIKRGKFTINLDDGATKVEKKPEELRLIPERTPGCAVCKSGEDVDEILLCDGCDIEIHTFCHDPPVSEIPTGKWFCPECLELQRSAKEQKSGKKNGRRSKGGDDMSDEDDEEYDDDDPRKKKKLSVAKAKTKRALASTTDLLETKEENIDFETIFPDLTSNDWTSLFRELFRVQRAEMITCISRFGPKIVAEDLRQSNTFRRSLVEVFRNKVSNQELPKESVIGFIQAHDKYGFLQDEKDDLLIFVSEDQFDSSTILVKSKEELAKADVEFVFKELPWTQTPASSSVSSTDNDEASALVLAQSEALRCEKQMISIDCKQLLSACMLHPIADKVQFFQQFCKAAEKLISDCERVFYRSYLPSFRARDIYRKLELKLRSIRLSEPVAKGDWRKTPYPRRAYETITDYEPVDMPGAKSEAEKERVLRKLETTKTPNCDQSEECAKLAPYSLQKGGFETSRPCLSRRVGCSASKIGQDQPLILNQDITEYDSWGFDGATRKFVDAILETIAGVKIPQVQNAIVEGFLLRCVNAVDADCFLITNDIELGITALERALELQDWEELPVLLVRDALAFHRNETQPIFASPIDLLRGFHALKIASKMFELQIRPKGVGVKCNLKDGFKAGTFISRYLGELYSPWRWFERQDGVKLAQNKVGFKPALPDFYNIMLERHEDDEDGYDVLFVDPIVKGNFASRLCHSCDPNCSTVVMAVNGKFVIAVYALRDVALGEELTFDYSSVTEDESEFRAAICLCGSSACRGSFLYYAGTGAFATVIQSQHTFLDRVAVLLSSSIDYEMLEENLEGILKQHGVGDSILADLPLWLRKWAALVLRFVDFEKGAIARELIANQQAKGKVSYTEESASIEAQGVADNRRQNVAITANKVSYFLRNSDSEEHPLRLLEDSEIIDFLWNKKDSVGRRAVNTAAEHKSKLGKEFINILEEYISDHKKAKTVEEAKGYLHGLKRTLLGLSIE